MTGGADDPTPRARRRSGPVALLLVAVPLTVVLFELLVIPFVALVEIGDEPGRGSLALVFLAAASGLCVRGCRAGARPRIRFATRLATLVLSLTVVLLVTDLLAFAAVSAGMNVSSHDPEWGESAAAAAMALGLLGLGAAGIRMALWPAARWWIVLLGSFGVVCGLLLFVGRNYLALIL